jgi:phosphoglycerol transferase MdoB-like AlkP superfamily enzyme
MKQIAYRSPAPSAPRSRFDRWHTLARPSLFFAAVIYYEELFLKLYCFHAITPAGALFTLLFTLPLALLLGLVCGSVSQKRGRFLMSLFTILISVWMGIQIVYYHLFKTFCTLFSVTKMGMVAKSFGGMATTEVLSNWFPLLMVALPSVLVFRVRRRILADGPAPSRLRTAWAALFVVLQLAVIGLVALCGGGVISLREIYFHTSSQELQAQSFGMLTETRLELRRVLFGVVPDHETGQTPDPDDSAADSFQTAPSTPTPATHNMLDIDFDALIQDEEDSTLLAAHNWFSQREPSAKNEWTGYFEGKNLVWIVAEGFSQLAMDPVRTPTLWKLSHEGFVFDNFYTPLWGVSTSDGEYVTTTGLIPKSGVWSYSLSSSNYMPFALGNQFRALGYDTMAFHDYLYNYYDRNLSHPNMGYEYIALGQGLELDSAVAFPTSDLEMMEKIVPMFVQQDQFSVYCLTVSGHLNYTLEENAMSARHWDEVKDLPYSDPVKCYLACQIELELAVNSLIEQLEAAGKLEDTVIVLSADHYPYGLTDEQYSELLGHTVDPVFERYKNTLILWNADMETPVHVEKYCSSLDVMPTLSNLFGLDYDSRLMMGTDILSDQPGLVIFSNYSFLNQDGSYNSATDQFTRWDGQEADEDQVDALATEVQNRVTYSSVILDYDYYRLALNGPERVAPSLSSLLSPPWKNSKRPENSRQP